MTANVLPNNVVNVDAITTTYFYFITYNMADITE